MPRDATGLPYHIRVSKEDAGRIALLPGDPARVPIIAGRLSKPRKLSANREFTAYSGYCDGERVIVVSTGIGGPATAIAVDELAAVGVKVMVRVGTCGALIREAKVGSVIIADAALRLEGTSGEFVPPGYPAAATPEVVMALKDGAKAAGVKPLVGITASTDSFFVGQGRKSFGGYLPRSKEGIVGELRAARVLCFEMEAATLFTLGRLFGLKTGAVLAVVANRETDEFHSADGIEQAVSVAIEGVKRFKSYGV